VADLKVGMPMCNGSIMFKKSVIIESGSYDPLFKQCEDYELLFTIPLSDYQKVSALKEIHIIGNITSKDEKECLVTGEGNLIPLSAQGWDNMNPPGVRNDKTAI